MLMLVFERWKDGRNETDELTQYYDGGTYALQQSRPFSQYDKPIQTKIKNEVTAIRENQR